MWPIFFLFAVQGVAYAFLDIHDRAREAEYVPEDDWY
jgi:hypothetical protein